MHAAECFAGCHGGAWPVALCCALGSASGLQRHTLDAAHNFQHCKEVTGKTCMLCMHHAAQGHSTAECAHEPYTLTISIQMICVH